MRAFCFWWDPFAFCFWWGPFCLLILVGSVSLLFLVGSICLLCLVGSALPFVFGRVRLPSVFVGSVLPFVFGGLCLPSTLVFCVVILSCFSSFCVPDVSEEPLIYSCSHNFYIIWLSNILT